MTRLLSVLLLLLLTQPGWCKPSNLDRILETGVLLVGTTADYEPFTYRERGELKGFDVEIARLIAEELNVKVSFVETSWAELVPDLQQSRYHLAVGGITRTLSRQTQASFTEPVLLIGKCPLVRREDQNRFLTLESIDQPEVTVACNPGGTNEKYVRTHIRKAEILLVDDNLAIPSLLAGGRADVMLTDNVEAVQAARKDHRLVAISAAQPWTTESLGLLTTRDDQAFLNWLNLFLSQAEADGRLPALRKKYGLDPTD
ncbi:MAG: transporter substrate-binding domain-containing protein [Candidatus Eremiobacteraeota bacterium]|nr:transporter substrate-binding domain-containing protein [Candidatus Eremiobacteraeota bacterium]